MHGNSLKTLFYQGLPFKHIFMLTQKPKLVQPLLVLATLVFIIKHTAECAHGKTQAHRAPSVSFEETLIVGFIFLKSCASFESAGCFLCESRQILSDCLMWSFGADRQTSHDLSLDQQYIWERCQSQAYTTTSLEWN